ncbi:MAG: class I SAM-dependent methyltransferase [Leptospiraceae bacterium]|nr:class I SAM-dependent methyltransferase [Leptospiraceae bacterium]
MTDPYLDSLSLHEEMPRLASQSRLIYLGLEEFLKRNIHHTVSVDTILDLGSGPGILTSLIAKNFPNAKFTGVDRSKEMIQFSQISNPKIQWMLADARKLPLDDASLSFLQHSFFLLHLPKPLEVLQEIDRVLKPGGLVFFVEPLSEKNKADQAILDLMQAYYTHLSLHPESIHVEEQYFTNKGYSLVASNDLSISAKGSDNEAVLSYPNILVGRMAAWSLLSHMGQLLNLRDLYGQCLEAYMSKKLNILEFSYAVRLYQKPA